MFGISFAELAVIMVVALLVFGPEKLPEIASQIGKFTSQLKRASDGFRREFYNSVYVPAKEDVNLLSSDLLIPKSQPPEKNTISSPLEHKELPASVNTSSDSSKSTTEQERGSYQIEKLEGQEKAKNE